MNPWYELFISVMIFSIIGIVFILSIIQRYRKKDKKKLYNICSLISLTAIICFGIFLASHKTSFKYNDWKIINSNINSIQEKYGKFDIGGIKQNQEGWAGYYIYTDTGPVMPDNLKHYYRMDYDVWGVIYKVSDSVSPGA